MQLIQWYKIIVAFSSTYGILQDNSSKYNSIKLGSQFTQPINCNIYFLEFKIYRVLSWIKSKINFEII